MNEIANKTTINEFANKTLIFKFFCAFVFYLEFEVSTILKSLKV